MKGKERKKFVVDGWWFVVVGCWLIDAGKFHAKTQRREGGQEAIGKERGTKGQRHRGTKK